MMKKLFLILFVSTFLFTSCSDDGPPGPPGEPGTNILGQTFEFTVDFDYSTETEFFSAIVDIPNDVEVFDSDAILVYRLEVQQDDEGDFDTWSLIPQNFFLDEGTIQYVYNHTDVDVELIIDGNFDISNLDPGFTEGQVFRFVVVPSDFAQESGVNVSDMEAVMNALDVRESDLD